MAACEFPAAYVDPYPEFFARVAAYGKTGQALMRELLPHDAEAARHFDRLTDTAGRLEAMARRERAGDAITAEQLAWVNGMTRARTVSMVCTSKTTFDGWYADLFVDKSDLENLTPTIADVHTQPTDEVGNVVGHVLHVGTGSPQAMVVTVDGCDGGARAYVGYTSSYYEVVTKDFQRLDDDAWRGRVRDAARPAWLAPVLAR